MRCNSIRLQLSIHRQRHCRADLRAGRALWQRPGLSDRLLPFDLFAAPRLRGDTLVVPAGQAAYGATPDTIRLLASTGRVLSTYVAPRTRPRRRAAPSGVTPDAQR